MKKILYALFALTPFISFSQSVGINNDGSTPDNSAILDIKSSTKGLLIPRLTTTERTSILSPAIGLVVFDRETYSFWMYRGDVNGGWVELVHSIQKYWDAAGANIFNVNTGNIGIGTNNPGEKLSINGSNAAIQFLNNGSAKGFLQTSGNDMKLGTYVNNTTGNLVFNTRATDRMWIDENGLVGIGTSTPSANLTVNGADPLLQMRTGNVNKGYLQAFGNDLKIGTNSTNISGNLVFHTRTIDRMLINENGQVGIGTSNPSSVLTINGTNPILQLRNEDIDKGFVQLVNDDLKIGTNLSNSSGKFFIRTNGADRFCVDDNGRTGIGTSAPIYTLDIVGSSRVSNTLYTNAGIISNGNISITHTSPELSFSAAGNSTTAEIKIDGNNDFVLQKSFFGGRIVIDAAGSRKFYLSKAGTFNFGTGLFPATYTLSVEGKVIATDFTSSPIASWPDYVFESGYKLKSLQEVKDYIAQHKHLPNIPAAMEVEKNGIQLGDMTKKLMEKVEELTLYVIQLQEQIEELKKKK